ncbi:ferritin-like domain-containing protein [Actinomycetes bacterium KLBMP 9759]
MAETQTVASLDVSTLTAQLRALEQLTQAEAQIARIRVVQARTETVRRELQQNGADALRRGRRILEALRELGAVPDVVSPAIGRVLALVKSTFEQAQPLDEALLGDLALEHQLLDRARYVKDLARRAGRTGIVALADELVEAHTATVEWLVEVLAEEALGGPGALAPTPVQRVTAGVSTVVTFPARFAAEGVNRVVHTVVRSGETARETAQTVSAKLLRLGSDTAEVASATRDAALERTERVAHREGADRLASITRDSRAELGSLNAAELPIPHYEETTAAASSAAIRSLTNPADVRTMIAFEGSHKNRAGVLADARSHLAALNDSPDDAETGR